MSYNPQDDIAELMKLYNQEVKVRPELPDRDVLLLRARLVFEEACEFVKACGCELVTYIHGGSIHVTPEVEIRAYTKPDLVEYVDACGDQLVVTYGALNAAGVQVEPVWDEVHRSNLSKTWVHCSVCNAVLGPVGASRGDHPVAADGSLHGDWEPVLKVHKREDGKTLKPPGWTKPDIMGVLLEQGVRSDHEDGA